MQKVQTVTGTCAPEELGPTLMHEHLLVGWPGWEAYAAEEGGQRRARIALCVERMQELRALRVRTLLDPCPIDPGRDVEPMAEVAAHRGVPVLRPTRRHKHARR